MPPVEVSRVLCRVQKPGRYAGGELNQSLKEHAAVRIALCFPDVYEVAMSHTGLHVLYHCVNRQPAYAAERCFAPWPDAEAAMRETGTPLWSLETRRPLSEFELVGFSLQYELSYPNVLNMLELGGIAVFARDRGARDPLVICGGAGAFNPEPLADFVDGFLIGEGEDAIVEMCALMERRNASNWTRHELLVELSKINGMYVPAFFDFEFAHGGGITALTPTLPGYRSSGHRQVKDLDAAPFPSAPLVPNVAIVHDRIGIEVQRGCTKGCRFCQAGMIFRPTRQRNPVTVLKLIDDSLDATGQDEVSLLSLSIGDYEPLQPLLRSFFNRYDAERASVSLPSLRTETLTQDVVNEIARGKKHSFTLAPEAGSDRMRRIINKGNTEDNLMRAVDTALAAGWGSLKYYFMIGLPFEIQDDVDAIAHLGLKSRQRAQQQGKMLDLTVSVSSFCPKPHTPFQWEQQMPKTQIKAQQDRLREMLRKGKCGFRYHNAGQSTVEGVIARGDRRVGEVIHAAYKLGCRLDAWDEHFSLEKWMQAFKVLETHGLDWTFYHRRRGLDEILPWDAVDSGVDKAFLKKELGRAQKEAELEDCAWGKCHACSACDFKTVEPLVYPRSALRVLEKSASVPQSAERTYLRLRFSKSGVALYLSHLETMYGLLRAVRRTLLEPAYSLGFSPKPKLSFSPALRFGLGSEAEIMDIELVGAVSPAGALAMLQRVAPTGIRFLSAEAIARTDQAAAIAIMRFQGAVEHASALDAVMARWQNDTPLVVERVKDGNGRRFDLRKELAAVERVSPHVIAFDIHQRIDGTLRFDEAVAALCPALAIHWIKKAVYFGKQQRSQAEHFRTARTEQKRSSRFHREARRDDAALLQHAPFAER